MREGATGRHARRQDQDQLDGSGNARLTTNEVDALELDDHADRGGSQPEEALGAACRLRLESGD